ncbi:MAG: hypothetical protein WAW13_04835 [Minisyncoccia bacterium]
MIHEKYQTIITNSEAAEKVVKEILDHGYIALENFLDDATKEQFDAFTRARKVGNRKGDDLQGTIVYEFGYSDEVLALSQSLHSARCALTGEHHKILEKSKQLVGTPYKGELNPTTNTITAYHYDGAYINLIIPLVLPENQEQDGGNLVMFPNLRLHYPALISKVISRLLRHSEWFREWFGYTKVYYKTNTLYIFFGDLSFHGVEPLIRGERVVLTVNSHW